MNFNFVNCLYLFSYYYLIKTTQLQFDWYYLECAIKKKVISEEKKKNIGFCKWTLHIFPIKFNLLYQITNEKSKN